MEIRQRKREIEVPPLSGASHYLPFLSLSVMHDIMQPLYHTQVIPLPLYLLLPLSSYLPITTEPEAYSVMAVMAHMHLN